MAAIFFLLIYLSSSGQCVRQEIFESHIANYSNKFLFAVPKNLSSLTTVLDISFNSIATMETSEFNYIFDLQVLNASYNKMKYLNSSIFKFNTQLQYLDFSHNVLRNISGTFPSHIQHLDISFNNFQTLSVCSGFGNMVLLEYLGLGADQILKSDFEGIVHLHLKEVFIELNSLNDYENGSLLLLNTKKLTLDFGVLSNEDRYNVLFDAVNTTSVLELSHLQRWNIHIDPKKYIFNIVQNSKVTDLTMRHVNVEWKMIVLALQYIWHSSVETLTFYDFSLKGLIAKTSFDYSNTSVKAVNVQGVNVGVFQFDQSSVYRVFSNMNIENLTLNFASLLFMVCPLNSSTFQSIDFSHNALTDDLFKDCFTLINLKRLKLRKNKLEKIYKLSAMTENMPSLEYLDASHNLLAYDEEDCHWSQNIVELNLASNFLTASIFKCLPISIKILILESNDITHVPSGVTHLDDLVELNLSFNRLGDLPDCSNISSLSLLGVEGNQILYPSIESIESCSRVKHISAGQNPFQCNCELRRFINQEKEAPGTLIGWPEAYVCKYPDHLRGTMLKDFYISEITCNVFILIPVIILPIIISIALIIGLCKYLDGPWFLKMIWQYTRTKQRTRTSKQGYQSLQRDFDFNAFISYSEHDASWVKNIFLPSIERSNDCIRICQHERNFIPGKSIIENIINCIEKSYKSIFILSPNFVQSEWCHYELYFAHHKLYTENNDNLILILLEPIPQYLIPSKYYKLKTLMAQRTYLEWPSEKSKHGLFWANLRAAISIDLTHAESEIPYSISSENPCSISSENPHSISSENPYSISSDNPCLGTSENPCSISSENPYSISSENPC
ncbi:hypothetical protein XENTR_v10000464 [Xenopus tropicalis]|uniref:Toll-like receptor 1 n=1 Tax=Xenopus tropicalis TaxID=8364 RepID=A0A6I8PMY8_XENTR|nr:toll-like receptor 1 [Xenopus tropicalis]XP_031751228.1 toll-like receptor 1 [Xenopus tropicalis]XP_031751229.1 toll-like receptor 1 [Xenopus tropicalis]XP_031751230.1 toll-like receptor 1 [Xenopus tropicalis]XP_031751231.1 toll-like receptor 1 [Xenopus tropicalis]XP_031751232.1 toll-like receptor 1 [Xenopus tropicalis]KAE8629377.1 hypothetical protein XENTR_v10000464 [Xenopus tropicalis]|eukprot:XP_017950845.1 PREDICTED: toll-like receptor 1 [Xenopus tropicalis]